MAAQRIIPKGYKQINFNLEAELIYKIKFISLQKGTTASELFRSAIIDCIDEYERKQGKIKVPKNSL